MKAKELRLSGIQNNKFGVLNYYKRILMLLTGFILFVKPFAGIASHHKREIRSEIIINATPDRVWKVLTDFGDYPSWNPFLKWLKGNVAIKNRIEVRIEPPGASGMTFKPRVLKFDTNKEFRWLGHLIIPGLFDGEHIFELIDNGDGTTTFVQREIFGGILIPFFKKMLEINTRQGYEQMNKALKERAEK
ncbi:MAG TPA: SRPBCC domain-containing protein [Bacteroidia bacterium]|jgi:hypothetical protein|nr:SRPBCC domain-containing protein [Bacteroidia bacterium]